VAGVASATVGQPFGGRLHSGRRGDRWFPGERPVLTQVAVHGACGSGSPTRSAGVAWTLNSIRRQRECRPAEAIAVTGVGELPAPA